MKVTGYQLREALRHWRTVLDGTATDLKNSLYYFDDSDKVDPMVVAEDYKKAEDAVAKLEEAQQRYNLYVKVELAGEEKTLAYAVKAIGMASRFATTWKTLTVDKKSSRGWGDSYDRVRNKDEVHAKRSITKEDATKIRNAANKHAADIRQAVALANATKVDVDIPAALVNFGR